jgi:hypothetical protein
LSDEARETQFVETAWLNYLNRYLFEHGTISEEEYKRMTEIIANRNAIIFRRKSAM